MSQTKYPIHLAILPRPLSPQPKVRVAKDEYVVFKNGRAEVKNAEQEEQVRTALKNLRVPVFEETLTEPMVLKSINWATYSQAAYQVASERLPRT